MRKCSWLLVVWMLAVGCEKTNTVTPSPDAGAGAVDAAPQDGPKQVSPSFDWTGCETALAAGAVQTKCEGFKISFLHQPKPQDGSSTAQTLDEGFAAGALQLQAGELNRTTVQIDGRTFQQTDAQSAAQQFYWVTAQSDISLTGVYCVAKLGVDACRTAVAAMLSAGVPPSTVVSTAPAKPFDCKKAGETPEASQFQCAETNLFFVRAKKGELPSADVMMDRTLPGKKQTAGVLYAAGQRWELWRSVQPSKEFVGSARHYYGVARQNQDGSFAGFACAGLEGKAGPACVAGLQRMVLWGPKAIGAIVPDGAPSAKP